MVANTIEKAITKKAFYIPIHRLIKPEYYEKDLIDELVNLVEQDIDLYGLNYPIVVNSYPSRRFVVIDGWKRVEILRGLGYSKINATIQRYTLAEEKEQHFLLNAAASINQHEAILTNLHKTVSDFCQENYKPRSEYEKGTTRQGNHAAKVQQLLTPASYDLLYQAADDLNVSKGAVLDILLKDKYGK